LASNFQRSRANNDMELRISTTTGLEEARRVKLAIYQRDAVRHEHDTERRVHRAMLLERERCAKIAESYGPNLMALHVAKLIRKS
jgi:hypothetical protein